MTFMNKFFTCVAALAAACSVATAADLPDGLYAELNTSKGKIVLSLEYEKTPLTVANFVGLAEGTKDSNKPKGTHFYDGLTFHRVIADFMIQGGDPEGSGRGGPGYSFPDETRKDLVFAGPGILAMANSDPPGSKTAFSNGGHSNGSQFFITHKETPWLNGMHTIFGHVVEGQEVVNKIAQGDKIETVKIIRVGDKAKAFKADQAAFDKLLATASEGQEKEAKAAMEAEKAELEKDVADLKKENPGKELVTTPSGLQYLVIKEGTGAKPASGTTIKVNIVGKLANGTEFLNTLKRGQPISFPVGIGRIIVKGWDEALSDMKKGEKRVLIVPPQLAFGSRGNGPIPPNSTLITDVELVDF